jgi:hypothetical protein
MPTFFLWLWTPFSTAFLAFKAFGLALALGGTGASFFIFSTILVRRVSCVEYFQDKVSITICPGLASNTILLISAS